ncbi:MAG: MarR family transcriptional regulator, partial [Candidatus Hydrogenedentes bacterium]|nr:MarR family transcriptional regulator [Candidatus Hydrogenedentota bacterium]
MEMLHEYIVHTFMTNTKEKGEACAGIPVTLPQIRAMKTIATNSGLNNKQLAQTLQVSPASASVMVDRLVELKLVDRYTSEEDRRTVKLDISSAGKKIIHAHYQVMEEVVSELFDQLGKKDAQQWLLVSRKIRKCISPKTDS